LGGTPACSSNFNGVPRPQNDSEGSVKLRLVQDRFWRTTPSTNFPLSVRPPFIIFLFPLLLPHTLLPLLLSLTSAYYLRRRTLPPSEIELNGHFGSALDLSVSLRDPTANIHDKKVLHPYHVLVPRPILVNHHTASFGQRSNCSWSISWKAWLYHFCQFQRLPLNVWCSSRLHLRRPLLPNS